MKPVMLFHLLAAFLLLSCCFSRAGYETDMPSKKSDMEEVDVINKVVLLRFKEGNVEEIPIPEDVFQIITKLLIDLLTASETNRLYLEDEELTKLLSIATGFGIRFEPAMKIGEGNQGLNKIIFLNEGRFSNSKSDSNVIFLAAIDSDDFIRSPFIVDDGMDDYQHLLKILGI